MNNSKLGFICSECGHPINGAAIRWKKGSPVCSCLFKILTSCFFRPRPGRTLILEKASSSKRWFWLFLFICAGIYLILR